MSSEYINNLHKAIEENNEDEIIEIICSKSQSEIKDINNQYEIIYEAKLKEELEKILKGKLKDLIEALLQDPIEYDANEVYKAIKGFGTDDDALIEIISTRTPDRLKEVSKKYFEMRNNTMDFDIENDTSQAYGKLITNMSKGERSENPYPNIKKIKEICNELTKEIGGGKINKDIYVKYFSELSLFELRMLYRVFEKEKDTNIIEFINEKFGSDSRNLYKAFFAFLVDPYKYFAERIHLWKDDIVIRVIVSQRDSLDEIKTKYKGIYDKNLVDDIKENTKDGFQKALLKIVGE
jgi:hypothetical protein